MVGLLTYLPTTAYFPQFFFLLAFLYVLIRDKEMLLKSFSEFRNNPKHPINWNFLIIVLIIFFSALNRLIHWDSAGSISEIFPYFILLVPTYVIAIGFRFSDAKVLVAFVAIEAVVVLIEAYFNVSTFDRSLEGFRQFEEGSIAYFHRPLGISLSSSHIASKLFLSWLMIDFFKFKSKLWWFVKALLLVAIVLTFNRSVLLSVGVFVALYYSVSFLKLKYKLTYRQMKILCEYNPQYLVSFLYNTKYVTNFDTYQKELVFLYKTLFNKFYNEKIILMTSFQFAPYLIEQNVDFTPTFKKVIKDLINTNLITVMLSGDRNKIDVCSNDNFFGILANNNLKKLIMFVNYESSLYNRYIRSLREYKGDNALKVFNLFVLANLYYKYGEGSREWEIIKGILANDLFTGRFKNLLNRVNLITRLETIAYFKVLSNQDDYNKFIRNDSADMHSKNTKKYLYILFTSVEFQNSPTFISLVENADKNDVKGYLNKLASYSIEKLATHRFTLAEKTERYVDTVDNIITIGGFIVAIVSAPATGGASLGAYAAIQSVKKEGIKTMKKVGFYEIKKVSHRHFNKNMLNCYRKKYQEKVKNSYLNSIYKKLDKTSNYTGNFSFGLMLGNRFLLKNVNFKQICKESK